MSDEKSNTHWDSDSDNYSVITGTTHLEGRVIAHIAGLQGGVPVIVGTRVPVKSVVLLARGAGYRVNDVLMALPTLSAGDVANALAYYDAHQEEIDADIAADDASDLLPL